MTSDNLEAKCLNPWTTEDAIVLCANLEPIAARHDCHVALTGGCLYDVPPRKDCDIVIYRRGLYKGEKELPEVNRSILTDAFGKVLTIGNEFTRVTKATYQGKPVDLIWVSELGEYNPEE